MDKTQASLMYRMFVHAEKVFKQKEQQKVKQQKSKTKQLSQHQLKDSKIREMIYLFSSRIY
jgi:hypothetical protein